MTYAEDLQTECTRVRQLCSEVINALLLLAADLSDEQRRYLAEQLNRLHAASRGEPFPLNTDKE
jgi:hypothetical protein